MIQCMFARHGDVTGLEMTRVFASGAASAMALARSRTIEALVLNRSGRMVSYGTPL